jgi:hypothetical protein
MKNYYSLLAILIAGLSFFSCKKKDFKDLWKAEVALASPVSYATPLCGSIKGTMLPGKTYTIGCDVIVNGGDTLIIQEGVRINFSGNYGIGVKGSLICLGTKDHPNWITYPGVSKTDDAGSNPTNDPALSGKWIGVIGATTCPMMIIKWTHIEFGGAPIPSTSPIKQIFANPYPVFFQNPGGIFVLEDSWIYGSTDDPMKYLR